MVPTHFPGLWVREQSTPRCMLKLKSDPQAAYRPLSEKECESGVSFCSLFVEPWKDMWLRTVRFAINLWRPRTQACWQTELGYQKVCPLGNSNKIQSSRDVHNLHLREHQPLGVGWRENMKMAPTHIQSLGRITVGS